MRRMILWIMILALIFLAVAPAFTQPAPQPAQAVALVGPDEICAYAIWYRPTCDRGPQAR